MQLNSILYLSFSNEGAEPVTLAETKLHMRIADAETYDDTLITEFITTARQQLEQFLNISLINRTVIATLQNDAGYMRLPYSTDAVSITGVLDDSDVYKVKNDAFAAYRIDPNPRNNFYIPCHNIVTVTYDVTWPVLPTKYKTAIKQQVLWLYDRARGDEDVQQISPGIINTLVGEKNVV